MEKLFAIAVIGVVICGIGALTSFITLLISVVSWTYIPRWRTFKNYVFLNIIIAFNAIYCLPITLILTEFFKNKLIFITLDIVMNFFMFASCCWLMVMAMLFYTDLVTVFGTTMTRKILKCNVFGWGLPLFISVGKVISKIVVLTKDKNVLEKDIVVTYHEYFYYEEIIQNIVLVILLVGNFSVYIKVVTSLMKNPAIRSSSIRSQKVQVATLAFVMSGILLMISILMTLLMLIGQKDTYYLYPFGLAVFGIQTAVINICFLISKANRKIWKQHLENAQRERQAKKENVEEHKMAEIINTNP